LSKSLRQKASALRTSLVRPAPHLDEPGVLRADNRKAG